MARRIAPLAAILITSAVFASAQPSLAAGYYVSPAQVDAIEILAPPPPLNSPAGKAEMRAVLEAQHARTPAQVAAARADSELSVFRFAGVMGPGFQPENLPFTSGFFTHTTSDALQAIKPAKEYFKVPRPFVADHDIAPVLGGAPYESYPSGHATFAYATAVLLAAMVPERARTIFDRARQFAENRVIAGVHYPNDLEAGEICGAVVDNVMLHNLRFQSDFARATAEVRRALGLPPLTLPKGAHP